MSRISAIVLVALFLSRDALAQEARPSTGFVYNTSEVSSLYYECSNRQDGDIDCSFLQTSVRKKAKQEDLADVLNKSSAAFKEGKAKFERKDCDQFESIVAAVRSGTPAAGMNADQFKQGIAQMPANQKANLLRSFDAMLLYCKSPTEANYRSIAKLQHQKDTRTCFASSNRFTQRFRKVDADNWSVVDAPSGPCGVVNVSRLEKDKSASVPFWLYYAKKVITNPKGEILLGGSCSQLDQVEYKYDWRSSENNMDCEYINLSPF